MRGREETVMMREAGLARVATAEEGERGRLQCFLQKNERERQTRRKKMKLVDKKNRGE